MNKNLGVFCGGGVGVGRRSLRLFPGLLLVMCLAAGNAAAAYYLSAGAFPKDDAEAMHQQLAGRGYPVYLLYGEPYEVRVGNFDTREKAEAMAEKLKSDEKILARVQEEEDIDQAQLIIEDEQPAEVESENEGANEGQEVRPETTQAYHDPRAQKIVSLALNLFGQPYKYGGTKIGQGIDCSFFTQSIFRELGISLPRTSGEQFRTGAGVDRERLMVGDLLFFQKTYYSKAQKKKKKKSRIVGVTRINHVGIYIGNGEFIHATINNKRVTISHIDEPYFVKRFAGARRVLKD